MTEKLKDCWYTDKNDWRRKYDFLVRVGQDKEEEIDKLIECGYLIPEEIESIEEDYMFDFETACGSLVISYKETQEQIKQREETMKRVEDKSYRSDISIWKFEKNTWHWNAHYNKTELKPNWLRVIEYEEAVILGMTEDEDLRNRYRDISFYDGLFYNCGGFNRHTRKNNNNSDSLKKCKNEPTVYIYKNKETKLVDYVGIVTSKNRVLNQRVYEHVKLDNMKLDDYDIKYFHTKTKADAEIWEAHLINYYKSHEKLNKKKSSWGECTFLIGKESEIEWLNYGDDK